MKNKGFMLLETLVASTFILGTLVFLYVQFSNLQRSYNTVFRYDTIPGLYDAKSFSEYIKYEDYQALANNPDLAKDGYLKIDCVTTTIGSLCSNIKKAMNIDTLLYVGQDLSNLKIALNNKEKTPWCDEEFKKYILSLEDTSVTDRFIVKYYDEYKKESFATILIGEEAHDKVPPKCVATKSNVNSTTGVTVTFSCSDDKSGVKNCPSTETGLKGTKTYYVEDYAGNKSTCTAEVNSKVQYRKRACAAGKRCAAAGCQSYYCPAGGSLSGVTCLRRYNATISGYYCDQGHVLYNGVCHQVYATYNGVTSKMMCMMKYCKSSASTSHHTLYLNGICYCYKGEYTQKPNYSCPSGGYLSGATCINDYTATCSAYNQNANVCGCASWGGYTGWTDGTGNYCANSNTCQSESRTIYY